MIGDAAGATLEFLGHTPEPDEVDYALTLPGGGVFDLAPGQITDDGELTLALCHVLDYQDHYEPRMAAHWYRRWFMTEPFDIGHTTRNALSAGDLNDPKLDKVLMSNAKALNAESKANGSLMRATPLGVFGAKISVQETIDAALQDAALTHPNPSCGWSTAAYAVAIRHLILNPGDSEGAFDAAFHTSRHHEAREVRSWLRDAEQGNLPAFEFRMGFVKIAFTHAFYHLKQNTPYLDALRTVLQGGGDTDTNACITGGLVGARWGFSTIPLPMFDKLIECRTIGGTHSRPWWFRSFAARSLTSGLLWRRT